jgi:hypothetical protein
MTAASLLFGPYGNLGDWLMRGLAVIGAAALGGIGAGLIVQLAARLTTTQQAPRPIVRLMRILGAITCGLLVAFALFHAGGPGGGGSGSGGGQDAGQGEHTVNTGKDTPPKELPKSEMPAGLTELRIVVVQGMDGRHYRIEGNAQAYTLKEVQAQITQRRAQQPPLEKLEIVLYEDSPDQNTRIVQQLKELAQDNGLTPKISEPNGKVP